MFPLRDDVRTRHFPLMTIFLIAGNVFAFLYELSLPPRELEALVYLCGIVPARYPLPFGDLDYMPFLTSMFLHGGWVHLLSNVWILWIFGDNVEDRMGPSRFLIFYLLCGLVAGLTHWSTNMSSQVPTIGASGAIAGVMGAYFLLHPTARVVTLIPIVFWPLFVSVPAVLFLGFWFATQFFSGTMALADGQNAAGIAWWAHVGGFLGGVLLLGLFPPRRTTARASRPVRRP